MNEQITVSTHQLKYDIYGSDTILYFFKDYSSRKIVFSIPEWFWSVHLDLGLESLVNDVVF
ncbi:hypothetical protein ABE151_17390 [Bacillus paralicheniformis]|uniref:hypothetical protein n=1 Tax=Bacillus paralicheniformis TaxID=1648923 RepID=UPI003D229813